MTVLLLFIQFSQDSVFLAGKEGAGYEVLQHKWTIITEALSQVRSSNDFAPAIAKYAENKLSFEGMLLH